MALVQKLQNKFTFSLREYSFYSVTQQQQNKIAMRGAAGKEDCLAVLTFLHSGATGDEVPVALLWAISRHHTAHHLSAVTHENNDETDARIRSV